MAFAAWHSAPLGDARHDHPLHRLSPGRTSVYKVEPYVVAADVYAVAPHVGRGGWTWYTGSAGWLYRLVTESILGLRLTAGRLHFTPCLPDDWGSFQLRYRYRATVYHITVHQIPGAEAGMSVSVDGIRQPDPTIPLLDDRRTTRSRDPDEKGDRAAGRSVPGLDRT